MPETLVPACLELEAAFREAWADQSFRDELDALLADYAGRPSPITECHRLSAELGVRVLLKREDLNHTGSHKINNVLGQALLAKRMGKTRLVAETGAGQHGVASATAAALMGMECMVYMVRASFEQKPYRKIMMQVWGGDVVPSPVDDPSSPGSLGAAISDAVRDCVQRDDTHYALGSVLNHVLLHQTVIGLEAKEQLRAAGEELPDVVIAPCGGGSNLGGISFPFVPDESVRLVAVEPSSCPTLTQGRFEYDFGDVAGMTPLMPMYTLGADFMPPSIHAGGLRYHGDSPIISKLVHDKRMEAVAISQGKVFDAAVKFANAEGKVPAPECGHGIAVAIDEALAAKESGEEKVILFNYCGHGHLDLAAYDEYLSGRMVDA